MTDALKAKVEAALQKAKSSFGATEEERVFAALTPVLEELEAEVFMAREEASCDRVLRLDASATAEQWRSWVRFVLADAPSPPSDIAADELRRLVSEQWDVLQKRAEAAEAERDTLRARLAELENR